MKNKKLNKIIYFDKETINNILQELNKGTISTQIGTTTSAKGSGEIEAGAKIKLGVPFLERLSFFLSGKIALSYVIQRNSTTTITSTEISEFKKLKPFLKEIKAVQLKDIENSSTFFRVAGGYLKMMKGGVDGVDTKEFKAVMDSYDGYDTYKVSEKIYVRFNNSAFISNYKRNELLVTKMELYCVLTGEFEKSKFDFFDQINKMESLITGVNIVQSLANLYPTETNKSYITASAEGNTYSKNKTATCINDKIELYDVVCASVPFGDNNEQ
jgi:hypothetical protein